MKDKNKSTGKDAKGKKEKESKSVKFNRMFTKRVRKALKAIALVGNCSTKAYAYSQQDAYKGINALKEQIGIVEKQFSGTPIHETLFSL